MACKTQSACPPKLLYDKALILKDAAMQKTLDDAIKKLAEGNYVARLGRRSTL